MIKHAGIATTPIFNTWLSQIDLRCKKKLMWNVTYMCACNLNKF